MRLTFIERHGSVEPLMRSFFNRYPRLKGVIKKYRDKKSHGGQIDATLPVKDLRKWEKYRERLLLNVGDGDIILIHSSMDGLYHLGIDEKQFLDFLKNLISEKNVTIVIPSFPITNLRKGNRPPRPYDPKKTLSWTGIFPNIFIADPQCIRTRFPFNSLSAMGPKAEEMMKNDLDVSHVYDVNSAWRYCYDNHSKIIFAGVKASGANTMAIHMVPDIMGEDWPIDNWYSYISYPLKTEEGIVDVQFYVQKGDWYRYVMEEGTSGRLKKRGILKEETIEGCFLGIVEDSKVMIDYLVEECQAGRLPYHIPKRFYKSYITNK